VRLIGQAVQHGLGQPRVRIVVHSEKGRFVVTITAALSVRPAMIRNNSSAAAFGIATYVISSITLRSYRVYRRVTRFNSLLFLPSMSSAFSLRWYADLSMDAALAAGWGWVPALSASTSVGFS
jgi:hypothetical protein